MINSNSNRNIFIFIFIFFIIIFFNLILKGCTHNLTAIAEKLIEHWLHNNKILKFLYNIYFNINIYVYNVYYNKSNFMSQFVY
jgi:hypothetical protein